ncbi:hypothetical protein [Sphingobacterium sp. HSC-15S19]|uniref:hypothetical protein n=1 Tax=Sphingobacterium TaxID=28453 RepID=UPI003D19A9E5
MPGTRHNFTAKTVDILGKRVGFLCSNPDCRKHTVGPHSAPDKMTLVGVAAHITAAASGGPRYDASLNEKERKSIENGIWLCATCSTLIDKDAESYPVTLLQKWKVDCESQLSARLKGIIVSTPDPKKVAFLEIDLIWTGSMRLNKGFSLKNKEIYGDVPIWSGHPLFIHWQLKWLFSLVIYNNSNFNAYNLRIEQNEENPIFQNLPKLNNLPALGNMDLDGIYIEYLEADHTDADEKLKYLIPPDLIGTTYKLIYTDDTRLEHSLTFKITENGIENIQ